MLEPAAIADAGGLLKNADAGGQADQHYSV